MSASGRRHTSYHNPLVQPEQLHTATPRASSHTTTGDALVRPDGHSAKPVGLEVMPDGHSAKPGGYGAKPEGYGGSLPDRDLAAIVRDDLLVPADIDAWLTKARDEREPAYSRGQDSLVASLGPGMSNAEIASALSDLER